MSYTHGYDYLHKLGLGVAGLGVVIAGADLLSPISNFLQTTLKSNDLEWIWLVLAFSYFIGGYIGAILLLGKTVLPYWLPTYLRVRLSLFTQITSNEADRLGYLFDGSLGGVWYPLSSIRKIDKEFRREALFRFANKIADEHGWQRPFSMPEDNINKNRSSASGKTNQDELNLSRADEQINVCLEILGLHQMPVNFEVIKLAYRRKIKEFHPDKFAGERAEVLQYAEETSKRLNVAYEYLENHFNPVRS